MPGLTVQRDDAHLYVQTVPEAKPATAVLRLAHMVAGDDHMRLAGATCSPWSIARRM